MRAARAYGPLRLIFLLALVPLGACTSAVEETDKTRAMIPSSFATVEQRDAFFERWRLWIVADYRRKTADAVSRCRFSKRSQDPPGKCEAVREVMEAIRDQTLAKLEKKRLEANVGVEL